MEHFSMNRPPYPAQRREVPPEAMLPGFLPWYYGAVPARPAAPPTPAPPVNPGGVQRLAYTVKEAAAALGVSPRTVYDLIHSSGFPCLRVGGRWKIPVEMLAEWVRQQAGGGGL